MMKGIADLRARVARLDSLGRYLRRVVRRENNVGIRTRHSPRCCWVGPHLHHMHTYLIQVSHGLCFKSCFHRRIPHRGDG